MIVGGRDVCHECGAEFDSFLTLYEHVVVEHDDSDGSGSHESRQSWWKRVEPEVIYPDRFVTGGSQ